MNGLKLLIALVELLFLDEFENDKFLIFSFQFNYAG